MNYKIKWIMNLFIFPILVMLPIFVHILIQSSGLSTDFVYPGSNSYILYVGLIYLPVWFLILSYMYLDLNSWKKFKKPQAYLLILGYTLLLTGITVLEHVFFASKWFIVDGVNQQNTTFFIFMTFFVNVIGICFFQFVYGSFVNIYSFKGGKTYTIHQLAFKTVLSFIWKQWSFFVDADVKVGPNEYQNYSFILTKKALYIVDYFVIEYDEDIVFSEEVSTKEEIKGETKSLFTTSNFGNEIKQEITTKKDVVDIFDDLNNSIKYEFISPKIELESNKNIILNKIIKTDNSRYISNLIEKNEILNEYLSRKLKYDQISIDDVPVINLVILDSLSEEAKINGSHEEFLIVKQRELFDKVKELEKYLQNISKSELRKIREKLRGE